MPTDVFSIKPPKVKLLAEEQKATEFLFVYVLVVPSFYTSSSLQTVVDAALELGIYVVIDWHDHNADQHQKEGLGS